ncbi:MAG: type II toxin-antitoxin system VapC family toxin [Saprospiraceae bacterium]
MKLIDSNILIYSGEPHFAPLLLPYVTDPANRVSIVSHVETLGFHRITPKQIVYFESLFRILQTLLIDNAVVQEAIKVRQLKKISLGDAFIAATALVHGLDVVSRNTVDFSGIPHLTVINPIP